ncbi:MAG: macro domain-containing protein [Anaerolineales bacterium]|nr:macro domain-containing protein [Anaerolineales bacterium]
MKIILADIQSPLITAWKNEFLNYENIVVYHGSIFNVDADALVSPANSFGFMDGGLDLRILEFFGWHVQNRLQDLIKSKHHGELIVGAAEIVFSDHPKIPFIISAPTMRVPMILGRESINVYLATRAVLLLVRYGRFADDTSVSERVKSVVFSGMGTGVGRVPPEICARQMKQAIQDVNMTYEFPHSWSDAQKRHQLLYSENYRDLQR